MAIDRLRALTNIQGFAVKVKFKRQDQRDIRDQRRKDERWSSEQGGTGAGDDWQRA